MRSVWGRCRELPVRVLDGVHRHACALGRTVASDDLFLLAMTELDDAQPARRALAGCGIDSERLMPHIKVEGDGRLDLGQGLHFARLLPAARSGTGVRGDAGRRRDHA